MSVVTWVSPHDCDPPHGLDLESRHDAEKVGRLVFAFDHLGFDRSKPALVGYPLNGRIQLLSGTHRHLAAQIAGIDLPVVLWLGSDVERAWGRDPWFDLMRDIPVAELETWTREDVERHRGLRDVPGGGT